MDTTDDTPTLSPFDTLEETFRLLSDGPRPIALDGTAILACPTGRSPPRAAGHALAPIGRLLGA